MLLKTEKFIPWLGLRSKKRRWLIMPFFGLMIVIVEALEHISVRENIFTMHFFSEVLIYGISIPILGVFLLVWIDKVELGRDLVLSTLSQKEEFSNQLRNVSGWEDLVGLITKFPATIMPVTSSSLFIKNPDYGNIEFVDNWKTEGDFYVDPNLIIDLEDCQTCKFGSTSLTTIHKCSSVTNAGIMPGSEWYCLPIAFKGHISGFLKISMPAKQQISEQELITFKYFVPEIALALENYYLQNKVQSQTEAAISERNRIAQDLHDTLGQNISYLRLKLDQINEQYSLLSIGEIESTLARMRDIADDAYQQMRETLADLHSSAHIELEQALRTHAEKVALRANFSVKIVQKGKAVPLRSHVKRQILYICREALNNVEKHANAHLVEIQLKWSEEALFLTITDDGSGFNSLELNGDNLGMIIMSERANDINAYLTFNSQVGQGMSVSLIVPLTTSLIRP